MSPSRNVVCGIPFDRSRFSPPLEETAESKATHFEMVPTSGEVKIMSLMGSSISRTLSGLGEPAFQPDRCVAATDCGTEEGDTHESRRSSFRGLNQNPWMERQIGLVSSATTDDREVNATRQRLARSAKEECAGIRRVPIEERIRRIVEWQSVGCYPAACDEQEGRGVGPELGIGHHHVWGAQYRIFEAVRPQGDVVIRRVCACGIRVEREDTAAGVESRPRLVEAKGL